MKPKISGLFNNCTLNCALPTLFNNINRIAEQVNGKCEDTFADDPVYQNYHHLKQFFSQYYQLEGEFTWEQFNACIQSHSFAANEIIFAPILRQFIAHHGASQQYDLAALRDISSGFAFDITFMVMSLEDLTTHLFTDALPTPIVIYCKENNQYYVYGQVDGDWAIRPFVNSSAFDQLMTTQGLDGLKYIDSVQELKYRTDTQPICRYIATFGLHTQANKGRYNDLSFQEAYQLLYKPFNIEIFCHDMDFGSREHFSKNVQIQSMLCQDEPLTLYFGGNHYELTSETDLAEASMQYNIELNQMNNTPLGNIQDLMSSSNDAYSTNRCLGLLSHYINDWRARQLRLSKGKTNEISAEDYLRMGRQFHNDTVLGRQTFTVILLTLLENEEVKTPTQLLYLIQNFSQNESADALCKAILEGQGRLDTPEILECMQTLQRLLEEELQLKRALLCASKETPLSNKTPNGNNATPSIPASYGATGISDFLKLEYLIAVSAVSSVLALVAALCTASIPLACLSLVGIAVTVGIFAIKDNFVAPPAIATDSRTLDH